MSWLAFATTLAPLGHGIIVRMETTRKNLSETKVQLTIKLGVKELEAAEQVALKKLASEIKVPGFRQGKVPLGVAAKHVDQNALSQQTLDDALSRAVAESFLSERIQALDRPAVEVLKFVPGEQLEFTAEVDIIPEVKLADYKKLTARPEKPTVAAADVNDIIERMRNGFATKKEVKRAAKMGDNTTIDFVGKKDDVAFEGGTATGYQLVLGSGQFIPGFEEAIVGHKTGETFDIDLTFPKEYQSKELAGQKVVFTVTLNKLEENELPAIDDELAKKAGPFETVAELKADIKAELKKQKDREAGEKFKDALVGELVEKSNVPVPEVLLADQMQMVEQDFERNLSYQGMGIDQYIETQKLKDMDEWREKEVKPVALKRVQIGLVLAELSKVEKVQATEQELDAHVEVYRQQYASNKEALAQFETPEVRRDIANRLLTEKTVERLAELNSE